MSVLPDIQRTPESFEKALLLSLDFDGTTHLTSEQAPGVKTVDDAYAYAIDADKGAYVAEKFLNEGGHQHRTPAKIINDLFPDMDSQEVESTAQRIVCLKKEILLGQIGVQLADRTVWPRMTSGFKQFWEDLYASREIGVHVDTLMLSAGHMDFIAKTFDVHGLAHPDLFVTDDILNDFGLATMPPEHRAKPSPLPLAIGKFLWAASYDIAVSEDGIGAAMNARIVHVGDSVEKDGGLARNANVEFMHLEPKAARETWLNTSMWLSTHSLYFRSVHSGAK